MVLLATVLGMLAGLVGSLISYIAPAMPTGPWIVMVMSLIAYVSFLFAPRKGLLARSIQQRRHQQKTLTENILKIFHELGAIDGHYYKGRTLPMFSLHRPLSPHLLRRGLKRLQKQNMVQREGDKWFLTAIGKNKGEEISQLHHLWELYLTQYLRIKPDHVHEDAESIEHIITPALAEELRNLVKLK